jgi:hypothetical protein
MQMFEKEVSRRGRTTKVSIRPGAQEGWELRVEEDSRLVRQTHYTDWHRVERALTSLALEQSVVGEDGWWGTVAVDDYSTKR